MHLVRLIWLVALLLAPLAAHAQSAIKFVIGTAPGGAIDPYARIVADPMAKALKENIIVEYKPGANGNASARYIAEQPADGALVWVGTQAFTEINPSAVTTQRWSIDDFVEIIRGVEAPLVFAAHPSVPANTFPEFLTWAKANKGKLSYASYQPGTPSHFLGYQLNEKFDLDLTHVPYRGSGLQATALVGGQSLFGFAQVANSVPMIRDRQVEGASSPSPDRAGTSSCPTCRPSPSSAILSSPRESGSACWSRRARLTIPSSATPRLPRSPITIPTCDPSSRLKASTSLPRPDRSSCPTLRRRSFAGGNWSRRRAGRRKTAAARSNRCCVTPFSSAAERGRCVRSPRAGASRSSRRVVLLPRGRPTDS